LAELRDKFAKSGLVAVTGLSIIRDCADLLIDLLRVSRQLSLLIQSKSEAKVITATERYLANDETARRGLLYIADAMSSLIFNSAKVNRRGIAELYDIAKHLQSFHKLLSNPIIQSSLLEILDTETLLQCKESIGLRIDLPEERTQLTNLHQEFYSFPFALNSAVLWIPLTRISQYHGTLAYFERPHSSAPIPYVGDIARQDEMLAKGRLQEAQKTGQLKINPKDIGEPRYLDTDPGTCYIFSALLPHASVIADSRSEGARLTCQGRFLDSSDSFFVWKHRHSEVWSGLKRPSEGWRLWKEYSGVQAD